MTDALLTMHLFRIMRHTHSASQVPSQGREVSGKKNGQSPQSRFNSDGWKDGGPQTCGRGGASTGHNTGVIKHRMQYDVLTYVYMQFEDQSA